MTEDKGKPWVKWVVLGCSGLLLLVVLGIAACFSLVVGAVKQSGAYQEALEKARATPAVIDALGSPIEPGYFVSGSVSVEGGSGEAKLSIPLSGTKGKGTLYAEATKRADRWQFSLLELEVEGRSERIDLLAGP
ncbi:MAG: cytochrome c oxidase assembly factor Coa1 family protein [Thermoanaerobaculia bacterium]